MSATVTLQNETFQNLLLELNIPDYEPSSSVRALVGAESRFIKDLKINVGNVLNNNQHLNRKESLLLALAVAVNEKYALLQDAFTGLAKDAGATEAEVAEIIACTSLMNTNNVFYRFRHFIQKDFYTNQPAGIKMSIMANPVLGKEFFELVSLVVSSINGCEMCVTSHERSVLQHGSSESRVLEGVKLGAIVKGLIAVLT
ncbi:carboxymuconolactone decarboxylase family protein [Flavitalea sp. BT771]|uniref:carboxymuconolactone decarboxylase family protein n=1 Tax=Flavitalea sp. BT771 TaxID=3063329 RepID=UPI0026E13B89|nr:carboxymuconolactone decarboxylase family protein [Flavitalea sp. BT771]MDO6434717.1 carboxymuconolactone decarboxylase family protein [Flavitalea sp. BT771]MDV6223617.1 carboxymuconolactone decarboxylase family protein [Flavitalea sp. BT771]